MSAFLSDTATINEFSETDREGPTSPTCPLTVSQTMNVKHSYLKPQSMGIVFYSDAE